MKKLICIVALLLAMVCILTACGKFTCDLCEEEVKGKKYKFELLGEEGVCCKDCHEELEELKDLLD